MPEFDGLTTFRKSGFQRVRDAAHLLNPPLVDISEQGASSRHMRGAMHLCGYGVECMLKAYLISQNQPLQRLSDVLEAIRKVDPDTRDICGTAGHDLHYLLTLTQLEERMNADQKKQVGICATWRSTWRYNPNQPHEDDAKDMVAAARALIMD